MSSSRRWTLAGGIGGLLIAAVAVAGVLVIRSQRAEYVRETLAILPAAESAYQAGRFADAVEKIQDAADRHRANPTWFEPAEEARLATDDAFFKAQAALWKGVEAAVSAIDSDPARARLELQNLATEAASGAPRARPVLDRIDSHLAEALSQEREKVETSAAARIPEARKAYEQGTWDVLLSSLDEIRGSIASLPEATRETAAKKLESDLKAVEEIAAPVTAMRAIRAGADDGAVKADRLRDLIGKLADLKGRDLPLLRELRQAIADLDPETRQPIPGLKLPQGAYDQLIEAFTMGNGLEPTGNPDDTSVIELQGSAHRYAIRIVGRPPQILVEVDRVRLLFPIALLDNRETMSLETAARLSRALRASRHPRVFADEPWVVQAHAPDFCALNVHDKTRAAVLIGTRVFEGAVSEAADARALRTAVAAAAKALEKAVRDSDSVPDEIKGPVAAVLQATHTRAQPGDHLDDQFCREAVYEGYVEAHLSKVDDEIAARLKEYRRAYGEMIRFRPRIDAKASDGATALLAANGEEDTAWRVIDRESNTTVFCTMPRDHMGSSLGAVSVFPGVHEEFPSDLEPVEVRMTHGTAGVVSRWTAASGRLEFDPARWLDALTLGDIPEHFGTGGWQVPPHALKVDARGQARELLLPAGSVKVAAFDKVASGAARREAQDAFLQRCSEVIRAPGEYHLFYRYFVQYVLDSPVTTATTLIGSGSHCGDAHQDAYQTLDRRLNGKFLADCDDLAELYWTILRKQDRPAFVLGVPGHATCGVAEKTGDDWTFFCVDTGPARQLKGPELDGILEKLLRTYDRDRSMAFDPRQMRFLFRFGGEQTRSDYFLDSRILRDPGYADLMIRVQEYWHFGFYALGIETMAQVLETDRMPANCQEIAGLYTRVGLWEEALKWTRAGIEGLDAKDQFTGLNDTMRVFQCLKELKRKDEAAAELKRTAERITRILKEEPRQADRYRSLKFSVAAQLADNGEPWDGWAFVKRDVVRLVESGHAAESLMFLVVKIHQEMNDAVRAGAVLSEGRKDVVSEIGEILDSYFATSCLEPDDSSMDVARKYGQYFGYRIAALGLEKATAELLKSEIPRDGRRPDIKREPETVWSWPWIRLSPVSYLLAAGSALDKEEPGAGGPKVAIEVIRALEAVLPEIRRQGSLGTLEFQVLDLRLLRACFEMDEPAIRGVFGEMKRQGWGALYESLSGTLGRAAEHMKPEDFEKVFRIYCEYGVPRRHYYGVVYAAIGAEARPHALAASKICIGMFPDDQDMKREHELLVKLAK